MKFNEKDFENIENVTEKFYKEAVTITKTGSLSIGKPAARKLNIIEYCCAAIGYNKKLNVISVRISDKANGFPFCIINNKINSFYKVLRHIEKEDLKSFRFFPEIDEKSRTFYIDLNAGTKVERKTKKEKLKEKLDALITDPA